MAEYQTRFGSLEDFQKGGVAVVSDDVRNYVFSNVFDVAGRSSPFKKIAVAKNLEYVLEVIRVEGASPWRTSTHDEFALVMSGEVTFEFVDLDPPPADVPAQGSIELAGQPRGTLMGEVAGRRGHMVLLPARSAYRYRAHRPAALLLQTIESADTRFRWSDICQNF
jgi:hypothetical protein